jgi:acetoin utilization deacetylase AcuC-like enzyme
MRTVGVVADPRCLEHDAGPWHPERPERLAVLHELLESPRLAGLVRLEARLATPADLELVHTPGHVARVAATDGVDHHAFDPDTHVSARSWEAARVAAGSVLAAADAVMAGEVEAALALVRPPGHHAEADRAMGFCLFNNVAVAARHLQRRHGLARVAILDWDVHHGNGSQRAFADDPTVLYLSSHQFPHYPGSGRLAEVGVGPGEGFTVNLPLPEGAGDAEILDAFERVVEPVVRHFAPDFLLVSAGFDGHVRDPLAGLRISDDGYRAIARRTVALARECCRGRLVAALEGGYDLEALANGVAALLEEMAGLPGPALSPRPAPTPVVDQALAHHRRHWPL